MSTTEKPEQIPATETSKKEETKKTAKTEATLPDGTKFLQQEPTAENEIHVAAKGHIKNYLGYAFRILNKTNHQQLKIRATGNAIVKANILIELVKRRVGDLHQLNSIYSMVISSAEEKLGEKIETKRRVTAMDTLLSKTALDPKDPGYQEPAPKDEPYHSQNRPNGNRNKGHKYNNKNHNGTKRYNTRDPKDDDKDGKDKDRRRGGMRDNRGGRRKELAASGPVKDDERRGDRMDRPRGGFGHGGGYGRPMMGDGRPPPYGMQGDRQGYRPRGGRPYDGNMVQGGYPPRAYDDFGVRPRGGQRGNYRGYGGRPDYNNRDMYMDQPAPHYNQPPYGGGGYGGGYNYNHDGPYNQGPPPDRRYNRGGYGEGGPRYNEPRGPRQPYNSERD